MPESRDKIHNHDNTSCKKCGTLLSRGKCIYQCVDGGNTCIYCCFEGVVDNVCFACKREQTGFLTKAAIK